MSYNRCNKQYNRHNTSHAAEHTARTTHYNIQRTSAGSYKGTSAMAAKTTNISIRMDVELKARAEELFAALGMNISTAFNIFVRQALREGKIPFEISLTPQPQPEPAEQIAPKENSAPSAEPSPAPPAQPVTTAPAAAAVPRRKFPSALLPPQSGQDAQTLPEGQKKAPRPEGAAQNIIDMF